MSSGLLFHPTARLLFLWATLSERAFTRVTGNMTRTAELGRWLLQPHQAGPQGVLCSSSPLLHSPFLTTLFPLSYLSLPSWLPDLQEKISWLLAQQKDLTMQVQELQKHNQELQDQVPPETSTDTRQSPPPSSFILHHPSFPPPSLVLQLFYEFRTGFGGQTLPIQSFTTLLMTSQKGWGRHGRTPGLSWGLSCCSWRRSRRSGGGCG